MKIDTPIEQERNVLGTFIRMSVCFGASHGAITAVIPLAVGVFGNLGDWTLGCLYVTYTASALLIATPVIERLGHKWALIIGFFIYSTFVVGLFGALLLRESGYETLSWIVSLIGAAIGGTAGGIVWTAQGGYFSRCAELHNQGSRLVNTNKFGAIFATAYLALELLMKLFSSVQFYILCDDWSGNPITGKCTWDGSGSSSSSSMTKSHATAIVHGVNIAILWTSSIAMLSISDIRSDDSSTINSDVSEHLPKPWYANVSAAINLLRNNSTIVLLGGTNILFGLVSGYTNSYLSGKVVKESLGEDKVGYLSAMEPLVAAIFSWPLGKLGVYFETKAIALGIGFACSAGFAVMLLIFDVTSDNMVNSVGRWEVLIPLFLISGVFRCVWEGPQKAAVADYFPHNPDPAFANVVLQSGSATAVFFMMSPYVPHLWQEALILIVTFIAGFGCFLALQMPRPATSGYESITDL